MAEVDKYLLKKLHVRTLPAVAAVAGSWSATVRRCSLQLEVHPYHLLPLRQLQQVVCRWSAGAGILVLMGIPLSRRGLFVAIAMVWWP